MDRLLGPEDRFLSAIFAVVLAWFRLSRDRQDGPFLHPKERPGGQSKRGSRKACTWRLQFCTARRKATEPAPDPTCYWAMSKISGMWSEEHFFVPPLSLSLLRLRDPKRVNPLGRPRQGSPQSGCQHRSQPLEDPRGARSPLPGRAGESPFCPIWFRS